MRSYPAPLSRMPARSAAAICVAAGTWQIYRLAYKVTTNHDLRSNAKDRPAAVASLLPVVGHGTGAGGKCVVPEDIIHRVCGGSPVEVVKGYWEWRLSMNPGSAFGMFGSGLRTVGGITLSGLGSLIGTPSSIAWCAVVFVIGSIAAGLYARSGSPTSPMNNGSRVVGS